MLIERGFDPQTMFSIYNGVDFTPRTPAMDRAAYLKNVGLAAGRTMLCSASRRG